MDLFNSFESGQFKVLVLEAGNDKNAEKGAAWDRFTAAFREVCFSYLNFVDICNRFLKKKCSFPSSVADPDPWNPYHFPGSRSGSSYPPFHLHQCCGAGASRIRIHNTGLISSIFAYRYSRTKPYICSQIRAVDSFYLIKSPNHSVLLGSNMYR